MAKKLTQEQFIKNITKIHDYKYDYSKVEYVNIRSKIKIICAIHGEFLQTAATHAKGAGCLRCYNEQKRSQTVKLTNEDFKKKAIEIHNDKYEYLEEYINNRKTIKIRCNKSNHIFYQKPGNHLSGSGCPYCFGLYKTHSDFIKEVSEIDNNEYEYLEEYTKAHIKIQIKHIICGTEFKRTPAQQLQGSGCPTCSKEVKGHTKSSFKRACNKNNNGLGRFYIIRCFNENEEFYKLGITSNSIRFRYRNNGLSINSIMPYNYEVIQDIQDVPENIWNLEKFFKNYISLNKITYIPIIKFGGSLTECFIKVRENFTITSTNL